MAELELTMERERDTEEYKKALTVIRRQGRRMNKLIDDMLSYTRLERRREDYPMDRIDLSLLLQSVCEDMKLIAVHGIELDFHVESGIFMKGNQTLLVRLMQNLIDNAYKYGKENGHIEVRLERCRKVQSDAKRSLNRNGKNDPADRLDSERALLSVKDDGIGIRKEDLNKIFNRFFRSDSSRSRQDNIHGNGLGLSIVWKIAELHGATIEVESKEGEGSRFQVDFPVFRGDSQFI